MITVDDVEYTEDCFEPTGTSSRTRSHIKKALRDRLKDTYGSTKYKEFLKIQGFDDARFDYIGSVMNMMCADLTTDGIDNNANKDSKSISRVEAEVDNANHKIAGHDALYRMMKKLYGKEEATRLSAEMYDYTLGINDATKILRPYCWALSGMPLVLEGRKGNPVCAPAKHLHSYVSMLAGTIHELSNSHLAGACLHASQNLIINDNGVNKSIKIKDFVERYSLDKTFTDGSDTWEFCDISNDNVYIIEDGKYVKVNKVMRRPYKDLIYTITTHTGKKVKCSKDHKFKTYVDTYESITKASSLEVFDTVFNTNVNTPISIDKNSYDYKRGQVIGILCGDGNITRENIVRISVNGEQDYIYDAFNSFVLEHYGKGLSHEPDGRSDIYDCRVMCKEMYQDLTKDIIGLYAKDKHIDIKDKSLDYLAGFLDGVYVTDGCFNHSCAFGSISEHLVKNVSDIASLLLMKVSDVRITIDELGIRNDFYNITVTSKLLKYLDLFVKKANQSKYFNSDCAHETADVCYFGKKAIKCNRKESVGGFPFYTYERYNKKYKRNTDVIVSIETEQNDEDYVYEIETESHWYSVGGILTHNCAVGSFFFDVARVMIMDGYSLEDIKEGAGRKYMTQMFQQFVFDVNDKTRIGSETPFTNLSFFDRPKMRAMLEDLEWYFDVTGKDLDYIQEYVMECQRIMMDFMDIGDPITGLPFTFPVQTVCIAKDDGGNILDMEFVNDLVKRPVHHYNILVSKGTKLASCCFDGNQKVVVKFNNGIIAFDTFENVFTKYSFNATAPRILHNGRWKAFSKVTVPYSNQYYKITTMNNKEIIVTEDHLNPTLRGDVVSSALTTDDYLLFNTTPLATAHETDHNYTYEDGYAVGLFLGDGSYIKYNAEDSVLYTGVNYSLNSDCYDGCKDKIDKFLKKYGCESSLGTIQHNTYPLIFRNAEATAFIKRFVSGESAITKELNAIVLYENNEFRKGILDGWFDSDGGNSNRVYSVSKKLIDSMELLCTSLGLVTIIDMSDRTGEGEVVIRGEKFNRNYPLWCLRWYDTRLRGSYTDLYKKLNNSIYFKIKSIEKCEGTGTAYCIKVKEGDYEPYFTLPNGIITHNCRLLSDAEMIDSAGSVNSFGGGGALSMGSHRVVCINLNRCAIMSETEEDFINRLDALVLDCVKILKAHKELIQKLTDIGRQPKITDGTLDLSRCFSTVGILGIWEMFQTLEKKFGADEDRDIRVMKHFNDTCITLGKQYGLNVNIEAIPGEAMAERFCKSDKLLFGDKIVPYEIYSNQTVPLTEKVDVYDRMDKDGRINLLLTGGGIVHLTIGERITPEQALNLIKYAVKSCCEHFALNLVHSMCEDGHVSEGKYITCPVCGKPVIDYALRIVGFLRPVSSWSKARKNEFYERYIIQNNTIKSA